MASPSFYSFANLYSFTYSMNVCKSCYPILSDFDTCIEKIKKYSYLIEVYYELNSKDKIHIHGTLMSDHDDIYKKLKVKGFNHCVFNVFDYQGWHEYITKDQHYFQNGIDNGHPLPYRIIPRQFNVRNSNA